MEQNAPKTLPEKKQILAMEVPVSIAERQVTEADAIAAMKRAGGLVVNEHYLEDLETIGIHARRGTVKIQRGRAMINQRRMEVVLESLVCNLTAVQVVTNKKQKVADGKIAMAPRDYAAVVQSFSQLSSKLTESQQFSLGAEEVYRPAAAPQDPDQQQNSFLPGAKVQPASTQVVAHEVHFHNGQPPANSKDSA